MTSIALSSLPGSTAQAVTVWTGTGEVSIAIDPVTTPALSVATQTTANNCVLTHTIGDGTPGQTYNLSIVQGDQAPQTFTVTREAQPQ